MPSAEQAKAAEGAEGRTGNSEAQVAGTPPFKVGYTLQRKANSSVKWESVHKVAEGESVNAS